MIFYNLPYENQRFKSSHNVLTPAKFGHWRLTRLLGNQRAEIENDTIYKIAWILPDGRLTTHSLQPFKSYVDLGHVLRRDDSGTVTVTGQYPNFFTNDGRQVWLTVGRDMVFMKRDYIVDVLDNLARRRKAKRELRNPSTAIRIVIYRTLYSGYRWKTFDGATEMKHGSEQTETRAEMVARDSIPKSFSVDRKITVRLDDRQYLREKRDAERRYAEQGFRNA